MSLNMTIHYCTTVRVSHYSEAIHNSITVQVSRAGHEPLELVLFDLPSHVTDKLRAAFADSTTIDLSKMCAAPELESA